MDTAGLGWGGEGRAHSSGSNLKLDTWFSFSSLMTCYIQGIEQGNCIQMKEFGSVIVALCMLYAVLGISTNMTFSSVRIQQKHIQDFKTNNKPNHDFLQVCNLNL